MHCRGPKKRKLRTWEIPLSNNISDRNLNLMLITIHPRESPLRVLMCPKLWRVLAEVLMPISLSEKKSNLLQFSTCILPSSLVKMMFDWDRKLKDKKRRYRRWQKTARRGRRQKRQNVTRNATRPDRTEQVKDKQRTTFKGSHHHLKEAREEWPARHSVPTLSPHLH